MTETQYVYIVITNPSIVVYASHKCLWLRENMHYSILIQDSPINGSFEWINPSKFRNPFITSMTALSKPNQVMFNIVDSINVVTNINGEEVTISPDYYTLTEIIAILNTMINNTTFSISTMATSYECIWIQSPYSIDSTRYI